MRVLIVDDHAAIRMGLEHLLREYGIEVRTSQDAVEAQDFLLGGECFDLVLLDIHLRGEDGLELLRALRAQGNTTPVLVHSMLEDAVMAPRVFKLGGNGYINKASDPLDLLEAIRRTAAGAQYVSASLARAMTDSFVSGKPLAPHDNLSENELKVLCLIGEGRSPGQIAQVLGCETNTVSSYRSRILKKLDLRTSQELMRYAITNHLVSL